MAGKKKAKSLKTKRAITGYLFILPFILGFLAFMVKPMIESLRMSFSDVKIIAGQGGFILESVGVANYKRALTLDPEFVRMLTEELIKMATYVPAILVFSFFVAMLLNQKFKGRGFVRAVFFLPVILSSGVLVGLEYNNSLLQGISEVIKESSAVNITGAMEDLLKDMGLRTGFIEGITGILNQIYDVAIASGIQIVIFLSGLQTISASMYEAAKIEGCTAWESFWKITFPMISSLMLVNLVYTVIDFFIRTDNEVMEKISKAMISDMNYGFSSAMAWIYFGAVMIIIAIFAAIISRWVYYYE